MKEAKETIYSGEVRFVTGDRCQARFTAQGDTQDVLLIRRGGIGSFDRQAFDLLGGKTSGQNPSKPIVFKGIPDFYNESAIKIIQVLPNLTQKAKIRLR